MRFTARVVDEVGPPPEDKGLVMILWVVQLVAAAFVVALGFASVALPLSRISVQVDPATLPPGTTYVVIFSSTGPVSRVSCPPPFSGEDAPSYCVDAVRGGRWWFVASVLGWAASVALFILVRRGRITVRDRRRAWERDPDPTPAFRQPRMPTIWWVSVASVGSLALLIDVGTIQGLLAGQPPNIGGGLFFTTIAAYIAVVHGWRRAHEVRLVGHAFTCRAPLRRWTVPVDDVEVVRIPEPGTFARPETVGRIERRSAGDVEVTLADEYARWRFRRFAAAVEAAGLRVEQG